MQYIPANEIESAEVIEMNYAQDAALVRTIDPETMVYFWYVCQTDAAGEWEVTYFAHSSIEDAYDVFGIYNDDSDAIAFMLDSEWFGIAAAA